MIVDPNNTTHSVEITPRFFPTGTVTMYISNTFKGTSDTLTPSYVVNDKDKLSLTFDYNFSSETNYNVKIVQVYVTEFASDPDVLFRGKILATTQVTQDYSLTASNYNWK